MLHKLKSACFIRKNPTLNKCVFKSFAKVAGLTVRSLNSTGNSFQQLGPATAKALKPQSVLWLGTTRSPRTADLKADRPEIAEPLVRQKCGRNSTHTNLVVKQYYLVTYIHSVSLAYWFARSFQIRFIWNSGSAHNKMPRFLQDLAWHGSAFRKKYALSH